jgi:membrane fusion protein (multidrug efflux system)
MRRALKIEHGPRFPLWVAVSTLSLGSFACQKHAPPPPPELLPAAEVQVQTVDPQQHRASAEVVGTVRAKVRSTIEAKVAGRIARMPVDVGQRVKAGQLLVQLDADEIRARARQAEAVLERANADMRRFSALLAQQAVTQQEYDSAQAQKRVATASLQEARTMMSYAKVKAPIGGVVTRKHADVGDLAAPGKPLLEIEDPGALRLEVNVPAALIGRVERGESLTVRLAGLDKELTGSVTEVAPSADPNSRTFLTKIDLPTDEGVRIGQFGRAIIPTGETTILRIPRTALVRRGQLEIVFVVDHGKAHLRLVKTGKVLGTEIEIVAGLEDGESVVVSGPDKLLDGQPVELVKAAGSAAAAKDEAKESEASDDSK